MTTKTFGPHQPGAVRCADCQHSPGRHGATCQNTRRIIHGLGAWRKCKAYEARQKPSLAEVKPPKPIFSMPSTVIEGKTFAAFCDSCWIVDESGAEEAFTFHDEEMAVELFRRYLRNRRQQWIRGMEIERRRASFRSVDHE